MLGRFNLTPPPIDDSLSQMVESHRMKTGQDYPAILMFGLWGTVDCSPEVRLYAGYRYLEGAPEDGPVWLEVARVHLEAGEPERALAIVDELERLESPGLYPSLFSEDPEAERALIFAESGKLEAALELFDALRSRYDDSPVFAYLLGTILHEKGDFPAAAAAYEEALEKLEDYRREAEEEGLTEELNVDFSEARRFIDIAHRAAKKDAAFTGERPRDLSGFREE